MTYLFDKTDVLTVLTLDKVKAGDVGYFGDCLIGLNGQIRNGHIQSVTSIDQSGYNSYPFETERINYALFLPADKVIKPKEQALEIDTDTLEKFRRLKELKARIKEMASEYTELQNEIKGLIGEYDTALYNGVYCIMV